MICKMNLKWKSCGKLTAGFLIEKYNFTEKCDKYEKLTVRISKVIKIFTPKIR